MVGHVRQVGQIGHCPLLYTLSRRTCPCLDCKTIRSLGKLESLRREHGYCTALQLIYALSGDTVPSLYTLSRRTCPCLDCKTVRSLGKLGSLRREHGYCTALQLISTLTRDSYSVCMSDSRVSASVSPTSAPPPPCRPPVGCAVTQRQLAVRDSVYRGDSVPLF